MANDTCSVFECETPASCRGWCGMHYQRWTKYGSPHRGQTVNRLDIEPAERLWRSIAKTRSGCWEWTGHRDPNGYGALRFRGVKSQAHRLMYELVVGPIPEGLQIDHLCRVRHCVNPSHMEAVTMVENVMRGESPFAVNARKTHCIHGHPLSGSNLYIVPADGHRECRTCRTAATRKART